METLMYLLIAKAQISSYNDYICNIYYGSKESFLYIFFSFPKTLNSITR